MPDLHTPAAKRCWTTCAFPIHDGKVLLVKHKKLGFWLAPGGHVEPDELPNVAAERETLEETSLKVRVISAVSNSEAITSENLPHPFMTNLHWVCQENYLARQAGEAPSPEVQKKWPKGCEQHLCFLYIAEPIEGVSVAQNVEETDDIGWFTLEEVAGLETNPDIKDQIKQAFQAYSEVHHV